MEVANLVIEEMSQLLDLFEMFLKDVSIVQFSVLRPLVKLLVLYLKLLGLLLLLPELDSFELQHLDSLDLHE